MSKKSDTLKAIEERVKNGDDILFIGHNGKTGEVYSALNGDISDLAMSIYTVIMEREHNGFQIGESMLKMMKDIVYNLVRTDPQLRNEIVRVIGSAGGNVNASVSFDDDYADYELLN